MPPTADELGAAHEAGREMGQMEANLSSIGERLREVAAETKAGFARIGQQLAEITARLARGDATLDSVQPLKDRVDALERSCLECQAKRAALEGSAPTAAAADEPAVKLVLSKKMAAGIGAFLATAGGVITYLMGLLGNGPPPPTTGPS